MALGAESEPHRALGPMRVESPQKCPFHGQHHKPPGFWGDPYWQGIYNDHDGIFSLSGKIRAQGWNWVDLRSISCPPGILNWDSYCPHKALFTPLRDIIHYDHTIHLYCDLQSTFTIVHLVSEILPANQMKKLQLRKWTNLFKFTQVR